MILATDLENWFTYHAPDENQKIQYELIRNAAKTFAAILVENTPPCADQTAAIRKLRECVMVANQSIACGGR